jgi:LL-diaminopimelate aminotransferase
LNIEGAKDVGVEVHTLSKGFNMTGFRIGFVIGNNKVIKVFSCIKENMDSGQYIPIQYAAINALNDKRMVNDMIEKYKRRQYLLKNILSRFNLKTIDAKAGFYQYVEVPKFVDDFQIESASEFAHFLLEKENIFAIPYDDAGSYIRFSLTFKGESYESDMSYLEKLYSRLKKYKFSY